MTQHVTIKAVNFREVLSTRGFYKSSFFESAEIGEARGIRS
jgi:hypothetical protein